jgi:hypothetical protein
MVKIGFPRKFPKTVVAYCDESCHTANRYFVIGGIFFGLAEKADVQASIDGLEKHIGAIKAKYGGLETVKWEKVPTRPGRYLDGYKALLQDVLETPEVKFKCMLVDTTIHPLGNQRWGGDTLVGYSKFYCVFLSDGLLSRYKKYFFDIRLDQFANCDYPELQDTVAKRFVRKIKPEPCLEYCSVQALDHRAHNLLQLADLLVGAVGFVWNGGMQKTSAHAKARQELVRLIQTVRKVDLSKPTRWAENWFNIWELHPEETPNPLPNHLPTTKEGTGKDSV